jgi:hypothetical protein
VNVFEKASQATATAKQFARGGFMRTLQLLALALMATLGIVQQGYADIPTYSYAYVCPPDPVNYCSDGVAESYFYGDFGMNGLAPDNVDVRGPFSTVIKSSNASGEVLGVFEMFESDPAIVYGVGGHIECVDGCVDEQQHIGNINSSGLYVYTLLDWPMLGEGGAAEPLTLSPALQSRLAVLTGFPSYDFSGPLGELSILGFYVNDEDQLSIDFANPADPGPAEGVTVLLSPFAIVAGPEPASLLLLATTVIMCGIGIRLKKRLGA